MPLHVSPNSFKCKHCGGQIRFPIVDMRPIKIGGGILGECDVCGTQFIFKKKKKECD